MSTLTKLAQKRR